MGILKWLLRAKTDRINCYLGSTDIPQKIAKRYTDRFEQHQAHRLMDDVWVLPIDKSLDHWVPGKIMGIAVGIHGHPFYFIGYYDPDHDNYTIVPYRGPIRQQKKETPCRPRIVK